MKTEARLFAFTPFQMVAKLEANILWPETNEILNPEVQHCWLRLSPLWTILRVMQSFNSCGKEYNHIMLEEIHAAFKDWIDARIKFSPRANGCNATELIGAVQAYISTTFGLESLVHCDYEQFKFSLSERDHNLRLTWSLLQHHHNYLVQWQPEFDNLQKPNEKVKTNRLSDWQIPFIKTLSLVRITQK